MNRIALINFLTESAFNRNEKLNILIIAAMLEKRCDYKIFELNKNDKDIELSGFSHVIITGKSQEMLDYIEEIKGKYNPVIIYFHEFSKFVSGFSKSIDITINRFQFYRILDFFDLNNEKIIDNKMLFSKIPMLPFEKYPGETLYLESAFRDEKNMSGKLAALTFISKGCPHRCTFCINPYYYSRNVFYRDLDFVVSEIEFFKSKGIDHFSFEDSDILVDKEVFRKFCSIVHEKDLKIRYRAHARADSIDIESLKLLKDSGCLRLDIGLESGSLKIQKKIRKDILPEEVVKISEKVLEYGIRPYILVMIGFPRETHQDLDMTSKVLERLKKKGIEFGISYYRVTPGSEDFEYLKDKYYFNSMDKLNKKWNFSDGISNEEYDEFYFKYQNKRIFGSKYKNIMSITDGKIIIDPSDYKSGKFEPVPLNYWRGDEWSDGGIPHVVGRFFGYVEYGFSINQCKLVKKVKITFFASTQTERSGRIKVVFNGSEREVELSKKHDGGDRIVLEYYNFLLRRKNRIRFSSTDDEGLSIFGQKENDLKPGRNIMIEIE